MAKSASKKPDSGGPSRDVERVQTGLRIEKRILKVLKGVAEMHDLGLGDLIEGIVLHAFDGKAPFSKPTLQQIARLKEVYGLDLTAADSHRLTESP
ncbi:MAG: hypothetical protein JNL94_01425 [Planctomycetes bacterium]|nr:hypothetical protein [Planctomycetota bacterium]